MSRCLWSQIAEKEDVGRSDHLYYGEGHSDDDEWVVERNDVAPGLFSRLDFGTATAATKTRDDEVADADADEEEGSVLDLPEEYVRAVPSRRPDIFPDLKEIKQPMPNPLPGDPEMPDEEEEEKERKENPGEPGEDGEEEDENGENFEERKERREKEEENEE